MVTELVAKLQSPSCAPWVIVLQSDGGSFPIRYRLDEDRFDWHAEPTDPELKQKMRILNAVYLPDGDHRMLYPSISPVNTLRIILNRYFGAELPLLQDQATFTAIVLTSTISST